MSKYDKSCLTYLQGLLSSGVIHSNFLKKYQQPLYEIKKHNCLDEIKLYDSDIRVLSFLMLLPSGPVF
ncbi:9060_t:CDS:1, partial [Ambispora gerdemannii]